MFIFDYFFMRCYGLLADMILKNIKYQNIKSHNNKSLRINRNQKANLTFIIIIEVNSYIAENVLTPIQNTLISWEKEL